MYACSGVACHLHFWQNDRGLLRATAITGGGGGGGGWGGGGTDTEQESAHKVNYGEENFLTAPARIPESGALTNTLFRLPCKQGGSHHHR